MKKVSQFIDDCFIALSDGLGTNTTIAVFAAIAFVPLFYHLPSGVQEWQNYTSQVVIQLIALAVIQKGTKIEGGKLFKLVTDIYNNIMYVLEEGKKEREDLKEIILELKELLEIAKGDRESEMQELKLIQGLCTGCPRKENCV